MTPTSNLDRDQTDHDVSLDPRLLADLQAAYRRSPALDAVDGAIRRAVEARIAQRAAPERRARSRWLLPRLSAVTATLLILMLGLGTVLRGQTPTPVSAQTVLHRAAAAGPGPNEATHATYHVSSTDGSSGTADVWIGYDGNGAATKLALTLTMSQTGHSGSNLNASLAEAGTGLLQVYNSGDGPGQIPVPGTPDQSASPTTISSAVSPPGQVLKGIVVGTLLAQKLAKQPNAFTLRQETLDGVPVYALQPADSGGVTYYFNAQSYVLEGADWVQGGVSWRARLDPASYRTMPLSAVPANTFPATVGGATTGSAGLDVRTGGDMGLSSGGRGGEGSAPGGISISFSGGGPNDAGAHLTIRAAVSGLKGPGVDLTPALAAACSTSPQAFAAAIQTAARSILATCHQTNASISAGQLVTALLAPVQAALDGLVRSGSITPSQEASDLAGVRTQLAHLITSGVVMHPSGTAPAGQQP
ncbi:MAG: hypothetical protein JOZ41_05545 [Chloroflexi bacterium]|nr:hypothetical protein [Chloroflexota bacterium]